MLLIVMYILIIEYEALQPGFLQVFSKIIKLANTKFLSDSSIAQSRFDMYGKN